MSNGASLGKNEHGRLNITGQLSSTLGYIEVTK